MQELSPEEERREYVRTWILMTCYAVGILLWGLLIFFTVGTKGQPPWGFGNFEDIPGESYYSTHKVELQLGTSRTLPNQRPVEPQHVNERPPVPQLEK